VDPAANPVASKGDEKKKKKKNTEKKEITTIGAAGKATTVE
jgi:hypothetical protein